ncbi:hypothetical protein KC887_01770 [Candidatus Kaiserbacteria bacterium]|nr:hypothetical protein [Candidatus Kaiserbacteria bacterium]
MINLLPADAKQGVLREYWVRVSTVWVLLLSGALIIGSVLFLPTYVLIGSQVDVYQQSAEQVSAEVASYEDVSTALVHANQEAIFLASEAKLDRFSDLVALFNSFESEDITFSTISMAREGTVMGIVSLDGTATDRQALARLRDELLAAPQVDAVDLPISNLARGTNIPFTMQVTLVAKTPQS